MPSDRASAARDYALPDAGGVPESSAQDASQAYAVAYGQQLDETEVIRRYMPMVKAAATHLKGRLSASVQTDDLIQAGLIAVLRILRKGGVAEDGTAPLYRSITNAMIDEARREAWAPVRILRLAKAASRAMRIVEMRLGRHGSDDEIAAEMAVPVADYHEVLVEVAGIRLLSLEDFAEGGEERLPSRENQEASLQRSRVAADLAGAIIALPEREKLVISLYYEQELNMDEVGAVLGLDKSTVCRAHGRALLMLRAALGGWNDASAATPLPAGD
jgi:RNA polymerase sigma factor for flagellar operon FliA